MVRIPTSGPLPAYTPHGPASNSMEPNANLYYLSVCSFPTTDAALVPVPSTMNRRLPTLPNRALSRSVDSLSTPDVHKVIHSYSLNIGGVDLRLFITIEPLRELSREHTFYLSLKAGVFERPISEPATLGLSVDPRDLKFVVFAYPPRSCLPQGCLFALRVWLRAGDIDHRLFSEDALWIGKDPDFYSIQDATFARLRSVNSQTLLYKIVVGRALMDFIIRWRQVLGGVYSLSLEYDGCGVGRVLFSDFIVSLDCPPEHLNFILYTIPVTSTPRGATHRIRLWLRVPDQVGPVPPSEVDLPSPQFIYQRIWGTDSFKVGNALDFTALGPKLIMGVPNGDGPRILSSPSEQLFYRDDGLAGVKLPTYGEPADPCGKEAL
ncbi:hypothetical protein BJY52DRAFT_48304 [Lactarius psammicola]|nr:hypothetical protein BJY52DRAFT_48304 [Lactarius psammicola]